MIIHLLGLLLELLRFLDSVGSVEINVLTDIIEEVLKHISSIVRAPHIGDTWVLRILEFPW